MAAVFFRVRVYSLVGDDKSGELDGNAQFDFLQRQGDVMFSAVQKNFLEEEESGSFVDGLDEDVIHDFENWKSKEGMVTSSAPFIAGWVESHGSTAISISAVGEQESRESRTFFIKRNLMITLDCVQSDKKS